jgi:hypothetical protein
MGSRSSWRVIIVKTEQWGRNTRLTADVTSTTLVREDMVVNLYVIQKK